MKKNKILKVMLYISFLPYITILLISIYHAIWGYDVYTWILPEYVETIYGIEAFLETMVLNILRLWYIPVLPICLIFQIICIISYLLKRKKSNKNI